MSREDLIDALAKLDAAPGCPKHGRAKLVVCTIKFCGAVDCWGCDPEIWTCRCIDRRAFSLLSDEEIEVIRKKVQESLSRPK